MLSTSVPRAALAACIATLPLSRAAAFAGGTQSNQGSWPPPRAPLAEALSDCRTDVPEETFEVERVVDGDTIWIRRAGEREKLRLLSVDTEEKYIGGNDLSPSKPSTRFGEQSTGWAQGFFLPRTPDEGPVRVGLRFPGGVEARDVYGRLLCHVVTREGIDFNLLLVRLGHSPYFNKYGNSRIDHAAFLRAQETARAEKRGIWDPRTNEGGKRRDYARLAPWWNARAEAVEAFRARAAKDPKRNVAADDPDAVQRAFEAGVEIELFGQIDRFFEEDDGSRTVLLRSGDKRRAVRVRIPKSMRGAMDAADLDGSLLDFRQNYLVVTGRLEQGRRSYELTGAEPADWRRAGPEPGGPGGAR